MRRRHGPSGSGRAGTSWATSGPCCWPSSRPPTCAMPPGWPISCRRSPAGYGSAPGSATQLALRGSLRAAGSHGAAYCVMSGAHLPCILRATTDVAYVRMHGPDHHHLYAGSYSHTDLRWWAARIQEWDAAGKDVFVYFNNDGNAKAVRNARTLQALLGQQAPAPPPSARPTPPSARPSRTVRSAHRRRFLLVQHAARRVGDLAQPGTGRTTIVITLSKQQGLRIRYLRPGGA